jgi:hypothetical protein
MFWGYTMRGHYIMSKSKENNSVSSSRKLHNPKSHAPAVYIPCWLIQVPQNQLSHLAKILYGRLAQWSNTKGYVSRSAPELSVEIGCHTRVIERGLRELRDIGLIETYQLQKGGVNSFIFLDHEFMHRPLQDCLNYYEQHAPMDNSASESLSGGLPPDKNVGTPPTKMSVPPDKNVGLKYKEIKENKKNKSFCANAPEKPKSEKPKSVKTKEEWSKENQSRPDWADKADIAAQSKGQMANEAKHIEKNERIKRAKIPEEIRSLLKKMRLIKGVNDNVENKERKGLQNVGMQISNQVCGST